MSISNIIIVGVGRSGTSLLQSMLAAHSLISFPPETAFLRRHVAKGVIAKAYGRSGIKTVTDRLSRDEYFNRTGLDATDLVHTVKEKGPVTDGDVYRAMLKAVARQEKKPMVGDKDPRAVEFLALVCRVLPESHVVHVIRDPRDVLASKKKAAWSSGHGSLRHVFANRVQIKMGRDSGPRFFGERYHELIYEDLLQNPEQELQKLCGSFAIDYEPSMVHEFGQSARRLVSESEMAWKKETLGPLLNNNHGKWKTALCEWEVALVELVCREHFTAGGYENSGCIKTLSFPKKLAVFAMATMIIGFDPFYRAYRKWTIRRARKYA